MTRAQQIGSALKAPFAGARWIFSDSRAFRLALAMGVLSGGLLVALMVGAFIANTPLTDWITDSTGFWYALVWIGMLIAQIPLVLATHRLLASVLTGRLQQQLSAHVDRCIDPDRTFVATNGSTLAHIGGFLLGLPKAALVTAVILGVNFIPIAGQVLAIVLAVVLSARELARDLLTVPMERRGMGEQDIATELKQRRVLWYLSGTLFTLLSMMPFVNLLAIPAGVAASTSRYADLERLRLNGPRPNHEPMA